MRQPANAAPARIHSTNEPGSGTEASTPNKPFCSSFGPAAEIDHVRIAGRPAVAGNQAPQAGQNQRVAAGVFQWSIVRVRAEIERLDVAVSKIADQQIAADVLKTGRGNCQAPGRIQTSAGRDAAEEIAVQIERIDNAVADARHVVVLAPSCTA